MKNSKYCAVSFTLIELLTVIAVIAILASLLLPSVIKTKERARGIICASQLKQIGHAALCYSDDYDSWLTPSTSADGSDWAACILNTYLNQTENRYLPKAKRTVWICPAAYSKVDTETTGYRCRSFYSTYACNNYIANYRGFVADSGDANYETGQYKKLSKIIRPSLVGQILESEPTSLGLMRINSQYLDGITGRHIMENNVLYADGHVKAKKWNSFPSLSSDAFWGYK